MNVYNGLTARYEVEAGDRSPPSASLPLSTRNISCSDETVEVQNSMVFPFPAQKCFDLMKDYRSFLLTHLKENERQAKQSLKDFHSRPLWVANVPEGEQGNVGSRVEYAYFMDDVVYWLVDRISTLDDGTATDATPSKSKIFRFSSETLNENSKPWFPLKGYSLFMIFTTFDNDPDQCHATWVRRWKKPYLGIFSVSEYYVTKVSASLEREMFNFWILLHSTYSPTVPKKDSKVLVIGAGPSGLHMTYELIQRGLSEKNITILEKDDRYGGKTLSIESKTNVQISNASYNDPPPKSQVIPQVSDALQKWYTCQNVRDMIALWLGGGTLTAVELEQIKRRNTPDALKSQEQPDYFAGGQKIFHELGTCYLSPGYYAIRSLLKNIQQQVEEKSKAEGNNEGPWTRLAKEDMTREVGPDTYAIESEEWAGQPAKTLEQWIVHAGKDYTTLDDFCPKNPALQAVAVNSTVLNAKLQYCKLHNEYLGNYSYTMPSQPDDATFSEIIMPFKQFLLKHDLLTMEPLFTYALTAQGYGVIEKTPTFLAMQWLTPDLLDGYFEWYFYFMLYKDSAGQIINPIPEHLKKFNNFRKGMLVSGWGGLWDRIVALYDLEPKIKFKSDISSLKRQNGKVQVEYKYQGQGYNEEYDFLIVGAPLSDAAVDSTVPTLPLDYTEEERDLFLSPDLRASKFRTTLFKPEKNGSYAKDHLRIFIDAIMNESSEGVGTGDVFGVRDSYKAIQPRLSTKGGHEYDPGNEIVREKMLYQYVSPDNVNGPTGKEAYLMKTFNKFMLQHPEYFKDGESMGTEMTPAVKKRIEDMYISSKAWTYYTHFESKALEAGKLWRLLDLQGKKNTLFVHASTNFESVLDIVNYNHMILDCFQGRLDNFIPPETDTRPKPWQRPQILLLNESWFHNTVRYVLNFFIFIIWSAWYVLSYPLAEGIYLRYGRWHLQGCYKTPELPSWWKFDMSTFNNVGPTGRGYLDYYHGKNNGIPNPIPPDFDPQSWDDELGPGDNVFKALQDPKSGFAQKYPALPGYKDIPSSFFWNLTDFRTAIRFWLTTFEDTFMPFLTPSLQNVICAFSSYFPSYYSWIFSWIFATQFRLLIGFSYRFEDEKGGGLRIPDCHMLRVAVRDHGVEVGRRICLTVCKVFTEETMRAKKFKIDFQPDFIEGEGFGCKARMDNPVNHGMSNHSVWKTRTGVEEKAFQKIDLSW